MKKILLCIVISLSFCVSSYAQNILEGKVISKDNKPIADVTIVLQKTTISVSTNEVGAFRISIPSNVKLPFLLNFSRVGYTTKTIQVKSYSDKISISLDQEDQTLNDVVVVGYGTQKKSDLTGSVISLSKDKLQDLPNNNFALALQGSLPGVTVSTNNSNAEGNQLSVLIGGRNSITAGTRPLIILDGIPFEGGFSDINMDDVQSIEVLKDASAVAIYGSRGSNGVILITGKSGKKGKTTISLDVSSGVEQIAHKPNLLSPSDFYNFKLLRNASSLTPSEDSIYAKGTGVNWYNLASQNGSRNTASLSVNGGNENVTYFLGVSSLVTNGVDVGDVFKRYTLRPSLDFKVNNFINVGTNTIISFLDRSGSPANLNGTNGGQGANSANPLTNPFNPDGTYALYAWPEYHLMGNPMNNLYIWNTDQTNKIFSANYIKVELPVKGLSYKLNTGVELINRTIRTSWGRNKTTGYTDNGQGEILTSLERNFTIENILNYSRTFGDHSINFTALYSSQSHDYTSDDSKGQNFPPVDLNYAYNLNQASTLTQSSTYYKENHISQMGRLNYSYKGKYLATITTRRDGYSGFGLNNKYGVFTTGAVAWNIQKEKFIHLPDYVTQLKLRSSYGLNGNEAVSAYQTLTTLKNTNYIIGGTNDTLAVGYIPNIAGNPLLAWEATKKWTMGLDYGFLNNRIYGTIEYYSAQTGNPGLLLNQQVSPITGYTSVLANIGKVSNKGIEVSVNTRNIVTKSFTWSSAIVMSYNQNKIISLYGNGQNDTLNQWFIGHPINVNFDLVYDGIYKTAQDSINSPVKSPTPRLGYVRIKDLNGDSIISTANDRTILGQLDPKITWGFTNTFTYKHLSLSIFIQGVYGITKNDPLQQDNVGTDVVTNTTYKDWWSPSHPTGTHWSNNLYSNLTPVPVNIYEDASFVRLKDISLAYNFTARMLGKLNKIGISNLKIYANARNLMTFTKYQGMDPELGPTYQLSTPLQKEFTVGLNVTF
jgi:TonB-linked SusC/RagA family outer membrane protein